MFSILTKKMEELYQVQGDTTKPLEDRSRGFGLLLHSSGLRLQQMAPTEVTDEVGSYLSVLVLTLDSCDVAIYCR